MGVKSKFLRISAPSEYSRYLFIAFLALLPLAQSAPSLAHTVNNSTLTINDRDDPDASSSFLVQGHGLGCPTLVSISVDPPGFVTVEPAGPINVVNNRLFTVTATSQTGTGTITVRWSHGSYQNNQNDPCYQAHDQGLPDRGTEIITINVVDPVIEYNATQASLRQSAQTNDPVNTGTGELFFTERPDLHFNYMPMPLSFQRYYSSHLRSEGIFGQLGNNWRHNFDWQFIEGVNVVGVIDHQGRQVGYEKAGDSNVWEQQEGLDLPMQLVENTDLAVWYLLDPRTDWVYVFSVPDGLDQVRLTAILDGKGNEQSLSYDAAGLLTSVADLFGRTLTLTYNTSDFLTGVSDGTRDVAFAYSNSNLVTFTDALGQDTEYSYASIGTYRGLLSEKELSGGSIAWTQTYDSEGRVATQTDSNGNQYSYSYDTETNITTITRPDGNTATHEHDASGALIRSIDARGAITGIASTETSARGTVTSPDGGQFTATYDAVSGKETSETHALGQRVDYEYTDRVDVFGLVHRDLTKRTYPDGTTEVWEYDALGNMVKFTNQRGSSMSYLYDDHGRVGTETNYLGGETTHEYDSGGNPTSSTDPNGNVRSYTYDDFDRITRVRHADGTARLRTYDDLNRIVTQTQEKGGTTTFEYDANNNLERRRDPSGDTVTHIFDGNGNVVSSARAGGTLTYGYDSLNRIVSLTPENGATLDLGYLATDQASSITDAMGNQVVFDHDANGRITGITGPSGAGPKYTYDLHGQVVSSDDAVGNRTTYAYNNLGRLTLSTDPSGKTRTNTFFENGPVKSIEYSGGARSEFERNAMDLITTITGPNNESWGFGYDNSGRLTSSSDPAGNTTNYSYDERNRVTEISHPNGENSEEISYDAVGNISQRRYSDGPTLNYSHDVNGRLTSAKDVTVSYDEHGRIADSNGISFSYSGIFNRINSVTLAEGKTVTYQYDAADQLIGVTDWSGRQIGLARDTRGNLSQISRSNGVNTSFAYDSMNRRTEINHGDAFVYTIERNSDGQVSGVERDQNLQPDLTPYLESVSLSYDDAYRINGYSYDARGRRLTDDLHAYAYDGTSCLVTLTKLSDTSEASYDCNGFGHMVSRTEGDDTTEYVWNHALVLPAVSIVRQNDNDSRYFVYTPAGLLLYSVDAGDNSAYYYHFDERGNTVALTDDDGNVVAQYAYDPYGSVTRKTDESVDNPYTFAGMYGAIEDEGIFHMRRRVYDPVTGQFLTPDPIPGRIEPVGVNPYLYAIGDPQNYVDPQGLTPTKEDVASGALSTGSSVGTVAGMRGAQLTEQSADALKTANNLMGEVQLFGPEGQAGANRAWRAFQQFEEADDLARNLDDAAKTPTRLGQIGRGLQVLDIALTMNKLRNELNTNLADYDAATRGAIESYAGRVETVFEIYHSKQKTLTWLEAQLRMQYNLMQLELINASFLYDVNTMLDIWVAYANGLGSFVPGFTGLDPDKGNNVGFLFF